MRKCNFSFALIWSLVVSELVYVLQSTWLDVGGAVGAPWQKVAATTLQPLCHHLATSLAREVKKVAPDTELKHHTRPPIKFQRLWKSDGERSTGPRVGRSDGLAKSCLVKSRRSRSPNSHSLDPSHGLCKKSWFKFQKLIGTVFSRRNIMSCAKIGTVEFHTNFDQNKRRFKMGKIAPCTTEENAVI